MHEEAEHITLDRHTNLGLHVKAAITIVLISQLWGIAGIVEGAAGIHATPRTLLYSGPTCGKILVRRHVGIFLSMGQLMIDFHYHYSSYSHNTWSPNNSIENILHEMDYLGITQRWVFPYFNPHGYVHSGANAELLAACETAGSRLIPVLRARFPIDAGHEFWLRFRSLNREYPSSQPLLNLLGAARTLPGKIRRGPTIDDFKQLEFRRQIPLGIAALKFHAEEDGSLTASRLREIAACCSLLIIHIDPFDLELLLRDAGLNNKLTIILAHLGSFSLLPWQVKKALQLCQTYPNLYVDCSAIFAKSLLEHYLPRFGDKLVFGSDGPCFSTRVTLELLKELEYLDKVRASSERLMQRLAPARQETSQAHV